MKLLNMRAVLSICFLAFVIVRADAQLLTTHYPEPSTNGALHYNRALLSLSIVPIEERDVLGKPIWEAFGGSDRTQIEQRVAELTYNGRHAIRAALKGTSCDKAEFGIDYSDYGHGTDLPHAQPMLELGRLITLSGIYAQIRGDWEKAAVLLFEGLRMGRHMVGQPTLAEAIVGVQILENNYYALAFWGAKCPDTKLVKQAFLRFEAATDSIVRPAFTLANEASIVERQMGRVRAAFPNGAWAEMLLDSLGDFTIAKDKKTLEEKAIKLCMERGVPASVFENESNFHAYVDRLSGLRTSYFRSLAACMTLPTMRRHQAANTVYKRAKARLEQFSKSDLFPPEPVVSSFATHDAERTMARVALAVAASRTEEGFPKTLAAAAQRFSGHIPTSPYNGAALEYQVLNDGKDFSVTVPSVTADKVELPKVEFSSVTQ